MVSHDRAFLNNIVTGVFCFGDGGNIVELVGGYDEWERYRLQTAEPERGSQKSKTVQAVPQKNVQSLQIRSAKSLSVCLNK